MKLDDNAACTFFELLANKFSKLQELSLENWEFEFEQYERTCAHIGHMVRSCGALKILRLDKVREMRSGLNLLIPCRTTFLHQLVNNLPKLNELSLGFYRIDNDELDCETATRLAACFRDHWAPVFKLKFYGLSQGVETALYDELKRDNNINVDVTPGFLQIFTVNKGYFWGP